MKILRLILFIPAFILTLVLANFIVDMIFHLINLFSSIDSSPLSFIWDYFLKSAIVSSGGIYVGLLVYPYKKRLIPLIIFSLIYVLLFIFLYFFYSNYWEYISNETSTLSLISQVAIVLGILIGAGGYWYSYIKDDVDF